jgi:capsular polysaccharide biosynthesis protein
MKKATRLLISLYPKSWRTRYQNEFDTLLDDVSPTWRTFFDVFGGALKMQMKMWSAWKTIAAFAMVGVIAAGAFSLTIPDRYVSTAVIRMGDAGPAEVQTQAEKIFSRSSLVQLITEEDLYKRERASEPMEAIAAQMKQDIVIRPVDSVDGRAVAFSVSYIGPDPAHAQRVTQHISAAFVDAKTGSLLDSASLPASPSDPRRSRILIMGLIAGMLAGALLALFHGLRMWRSAAALGIVGAILCGAASFIVPSKFSSNAVLFYQARDKATAEASLSKLLADATSNFTVDEIAQRFKLYPGNPQPARKLAEHLRIQHAPNSPAILVQFDDTDQATAQRVAKDVALRLYRESRKTNGEIEVEILDAASFPQVPYSPNRAMAAGTGLGLGLLVATLLGIKERRRNRA